MMTNPKQVGPKQWENQLNTKYYWTKAKTGNIRKQDSRLKTITHRDFQNKKDTSGKHIHPWSHIQLILVPSLFVKNHLGFFSKRARWLSWWLQIMTLIKLNNLTYRRNITANSQDTTLVWLFRFLLTWGSLSYCKSLQQKHRRVQQLTQSHSCCSNKITISFFYTSELQPQVNAQFWFFCE